MNAIKQSQNIFLIGLPGAGKSAVGHFLAKHLQKKYFDTDHVIEERAGANIPWIFDIEGEEGFRLRESRVIDELTQMKNIVLATGGGAILRPVNRQALSSRGTVIYLRVSIEEQLSRTSRNQNRPLLLNNNPREVLERLRRERGPLYEEIADFSYDTDTHTVFAIGNLIIEDLQKKGAQL